VINRSGDVFNLPPLCVLGAGGRFGGPAWYSGGPSGVGRGHRWVHHKICVIYDVYAMASDEKVTKSKGENISINISRFVINLSLQNHF
jgi:hypothetical protein